MTTCESCTHYHATTCLRYPPAILPGFPTGRYGYPQVADDLMACGEHEEAQAPEVDEDQVDEDQVEDDNSAVVEGVAYEPDDDEQGCGTDAPEADASEPCTDTEDEGGQ